MQGREPVTESVRVEGLTVRFVDGEPSEEVINAAHLCISRARLKPPMTLRVRWAEDGHSIRSLRLVLADGEEVYTTGPALLPALHKLCAHAASFAAASPEDRLRWREASARQSSGVYTAVK